MGLLETHICRRKALGRSNRLEGPTVIEEEEEEDSTVLLHPGQVL